VLPRSRRSVRAGRNDLPSTSDVTSKPFATRPHPIPATRTKRATSGRAGRPASSVPRKRRSPDRQPEPPQTSYAPVTVHHGCIGGVPAPSASSGHRRRGRGPTASRGRSSDRIVRTALDRRRPAASSAPEGSCARLRIRAEQSWRRVISPEPRKERETRHGAGRRGRNEPLQPPQRRAFDEEGLRIALQHNALRLISSGPLGAEGIVVTLRVGGGQEFARGDHGPLDAGS
jgi:hypothetical protein